MGKQRPASAEGLPPLRQFTATEYKPVVREK